jgi:hypothetical protein
VRKDALPDIVNLIVGAFLFLSPWLFGFAGDAAASWNAWVSGIVIAALAIAALSAFAEWEEWLNLIVGLWVAASPWLVKFAENTTAMRLHLIAGIVVAIVAAMRIWSVHNGPRVTA